MTIDDMDGVRERLDESLGSEGLLTAFRPLRADLRALLDDHARLAAEVERLTRERDLAKANARAWADERVSMRDDRDRLAAALAELRTGVTRVVHLALHDSDEGTEWSDELEDAARRARAALAATPADLATARDARVRAEAEERGARWMHAAIRKTLHDRYHSAGAADWDDPAEVCRAARAEAERIERGGR